MHRIFRRKSLRSLSLNQWEIFCFRNDTLGEENFQSFFLFYQLTSLGNNFLTPEKV